LTSNELGIAFGLPSWLWHSGQQVLSFPLVPLQILDGCLQGILPLIAAAPVLPMIIPAPIGPDSTRIWLPNLQQFLPHSWIDSLVVTAKAVKHDDAAAPTQLWDTRCTLAMPHIAPALPPLWRGVMHLAAHLVLRIFCGFLTAHYGPTWMQTFPHL
jgi:hypothetical protein